MSLLEVGSIEVFAQSQGSCALVLSAVSACTCSQTESCICVAAVLTNFALYHLGPKLTLHLQNMTSNMLDVQGSATLSMAYAGALFADSCLRGLNGDSNVFDYSYVESDVTDVPFFSSRVDLGPEGKCTLRPPPPSSTQAHHISPFLPPFLLVSLSSAHTPVVHLLSCFVSCQEELRVYGAMTALHVTSHCLPIQPLLLVVSIRQLLAQLLWHPHSMLDSPSGACPMQSHIHNRAPCQCASHNMLT